MRNYDIHSVPRIPLRYDVRQCGIYCILNHENGKFYIGSSLNCYHRVRSQHLARLRNRTHTNPRLQASFYKYGEDAFEYFVIEECAASDLVLVEQDYLDNTCCIDREIGYNINTRADVVVLTEEQRKKISIAKKGCVHSDETRKKISDAGRLRKWSDKQRAKFIASNTGKKRSEESKKRMSDAQKLSHIKLGHKRHDEANQKPKSDRKARRMSEEEKRGLSLALLGNKRALGHKHSDEAKKRIGMANKGRKHSEEAIKKIKEAAKRRWNK
jgi:group I intron endonuclease